MISEVIGFLRAGGVVIFPTETVYALACDASNYCARLRIYRIKQRNTKKHLPVMVAGLSFLEDLVVLGERQRNLVSKYCPGPVTFILPRRVAPHLRFRFPEKVAVRIPDSKVALRILRGFGRPVFATSLNLSGRPPVKNFNQISSYIKNRVDCIVCDNRGVKGIASSIMDICREEVTLIRKGVISALH